MFSILRLRPAAIACRGARIQACRLNPFVLRSLSTTTRLREEVAVATHTRPLSLLQLEGHRTDQCREPLVCIACGTEGHWQKSCPNPDPTRVAAVIVKCFRCGEAGHKIEDCAQPPPNCYYCGADDHNLRQCPTRKTEIAARQTVAREAMEAAREAKAASHEARLAERAAAKQAAKQEAKEARAAEKAAKDAA
ncbi:hypothetical protein B0H16DRAFT_1717354 [Mycena metata]|uniref:CCHC-type domain-containing protein n=1 Tax=Mycena metata TaxID=1033252 RepID=A0AAD7JJF0_9AGAR|nr:hypothetical protein B0H16DRAFT_1717354 [Mycena metata]